MRNWKWMALEVLAASALLVGCGGGERESSGGEIPPLNPWTVSPVQVYGRLHVCGTHVCSESDEEIQLRGMSLFWSNSGWGGDKFYNATLVANLADYWNATVIRAAIGAQGGGDYTVAPAANMSSAQAVIDAAIDKGMYVIVDWHSHGNGAGDLTVMQSQATSFFETLAEKYAGVPNIIWEPFNEPPSTTYSWSEIKAYHEAIISVIRAQGSHNLVVVGSPNWSQDVDVAAANQVSDDDSNVAYALHFYAGTHGKSLRDKADAAMSHGAAIFVTEYGTCDASGSGGFDPVATQEWIDWMDSNLISSANWSMNDKVETASALVAGASTTGPWGSGDLTKSGFLVLEYIHAGYQQPE
jgi:endoglucanase